MLKKYALLFAILILWLCPVTLFVSLPLALLYLHWAGKFSRRNLLIVCIIGGFLFAIPYLLAKYVNNNS